MSRILAIRTSLSPPFEQRRVNVQSLGLFMERLASARRPTPVLKIGQCLIHKPGRWAVPLAPSPYRVISRQSAVNLLPRLSFGFGCCEASSLLERVNALWHTLEIEYIWIVKKFMRQLNVRCVCVLPEYHFWEMDIEMVWIKIYQ